MPDLKAFLWPERVAVIGASSNAEILRGRIMQVMLEHDFSGEIYPISRSESEIMGLTAYKSIADTPARVDLAIIIIPAAFVPQVLEDCGKAGVKAAQIITSGFAEERGADGGGLQEQLRDIAERYDMAVCGPNSEGFANTGAKLCPTFSPAMDMGDTPLLPPGNNGGKVAIIAQSGGIGFAFFDHGRPKGIPFNYIITTGNEAVLEIVDFLDHMLDEGLTEVFILFLENVKSPEKFRRVADKALALGKPIIVVKIGQSQAGVRAAMSHTAALAGDYAGYSAVFERYGVIEAADIEEAVDIAAAFSFLGKRKSSGKRVAISTGSGGAGGWMADSATAAGLEVPELDDATRIKIEALLPAYGSARNPVDATAQAIREVGNAALIRMLSESPVIDAVIAISSSRLPHTLEGNAEALRQVAAEIDIPVAFYSYTDPHPRSVEILTGAGFPLYTRMTSCARALYALAHYREIHEARLAAGAEISARHAGAEPAAVLLAKSGKVVCEYEASTILGHYDLPFPAARLVQSAEEAGDAVAELNAPVALKVQSPLMPHKSDAGLVMLGVADAEAAKLAYGVLADRAAGTPAADDLRGILVQEMAPRGREFILGVHQDETFGPMLLVGLGGVLAEAIEDVVVAPTPVSPVQAGEMLDRLRGAKLLGPWRGQPPADRDALIAAMVSLSHFALDFADDVAEIDLNPVLVHDQGEGITIVDALIIKRDTA